MTPVFPYISGWDFAFYLTWSCRELNPGPVVFRRAALHPCRYQPAPMLIFVIVDIAVLPVQIGDVLRPEFLSN